MSRLRLIAFNTFRTIMSQRALYMWASALVIISLGVAPPLLMVRGQEPAQVAYVHGSVLAAALDVFSVLLVVAAVVLGATAVSGDITSKRVLMLLSRPVRRWEMLVGKWAGVMLFTMTSLGAALTLGLSTAGVLGVPIHRDALWNPVAQTIVAAGMAAAVAIAFSTVGPAVLAIALTLPMGVLPRQIDRLAADPDPGLRSVGMMLDRFTPDGYISRYPHVTWSPRPARPGVRLPPSMMAPPEVSYAADATTLAGNAAFGTFVFALGCLWFSRRDIVGG